MFDLLHYTLEQEAHVIRSAFGSGLTSLRKANLNERGAFYTAFFQLAIGFERLAKLGLILDHMAHNQLAPLGETAIRDMGHDLSALYSRLELSSTTRGYELAQTFNPTAEGKRILDFLTRFAKGMRYANLDALASGSQKLTPFSEWAIVLQEILEAKVPPKKVSDVRSRAASLGQIVGDITLVIGNDLQGQGLDFRSAFATPAIYECVAPHVIWEILVLIAPLREFAEHTANLARRTAASKGSGKSLPYLSEFFDFMVLHREYQMTKKRWPN